MTTNVSKCVANICLPIPPILMIFCVFLQPQPPQDPEYVDYDSADSAESEMEEEEEDVFEGSTAGNEKEDKDNTEHSNPGSFAWCVLRLGIVQVVELQLKDFLTTAGVELQGKEIVKRVTHFCINYMGSYCNNCSQAIQNTTTVCIFLCE